MSGIGTDLVSSTTIANREAKHAALPGLGWKKKKGFWISPHTGHRYDIIGARTIEEYRGSFHKAKRRDYDQSRPPRPDRKPKGRPADIRTSPQRKFQFA